MGFILRRRTKGAKSWTNFSGSKSRGLGMSQSQKLGDNLTLNFSKRGLTATYNLGNGIRYVKTRKLFSKTKEKTAVVKPKVTKSKSYSSSHTHVDYAPTLVQRRASAFANEMRMLNGIFGIDDTKPLPRTAKEKIISFADSILDDVFNVAVISSIAFAFIVYATMSSIGFLNAILFAYVIHFAAVSIAYWRTTQYEDILDTAVKVIAPPIIIGIPVGVVLTILNFFSII